MASLALLDGLVSNIFAETAAIEHVQVFHDSPAIEHVQVFMKPIMQYDDMHHTTNPHLDTACHS